MSIQTWIGLEGHAQFEAREAVGIAEDHAALFHDQHRCARPLRLEVRPHERVHGSRDDRNLSLEAERAQYHVNGAWRVIGGFDVLLLDIARCGDEPLT